MGVPWGMPATTEMLASAKSLLPHHAKWAAFGISRWEFPMVAQAVLLGGHVRVGIEHNLYLEKRGETTRAIIGAAFAILN